MGDRGRLVVPPELRERLNIAPRTPLVLFETSVGVVLCTREQLKSLVRERLADRDLVAGLIADRRREAGADDVA